jgi:DNA-binding MarR family transcriptional regulator
MTGGNLLKIIQEIRKFDPQIESQAIAIFFLVGLEAGKDGISMQDIANKLDLAQSSVSRNVFKLSFNNKNRNIGLVESFEDPKERRRKLVILSPKGKMVFDTLKDYVKQ